MTANGNSPLDNMRTLEHYLSDIMRAGAADTPEHLKGMFHIFKLCAIETMYNERVISMKVAVCVLIPVKLETWKFLLKVLRRNCRELCSLSRLQRLGMR